VKSASCRFVVAGVLLALCPVYAQQPPPKQPPASDEKRAGSKSAETAAKPKRQRIVSSLAGFELLEASKTQKQPMVVGATRNPPMPVALAPRLGRVYGLHPVFAWSFAGKAAKFILLLSDAAKTELFRREVTGTQFQYPADAPPLEPGKTYFWTVQSPLGMLGATTSAPAGFVVVSTAQSEEIETALAQISPSDTFERDFARARVFTDHRLWYDAIAAYTDLLARFPGRAELYEQRGQIYAQLEVTQALANKDFARTEKPKVK
jgi:hypothetical protein